MHLMIAEKKFFFPYLENNMDPAILKPYWWISTSWTEMFCLRISLHLLQLHDAGISCVPYKTVLIKSS